MFKIIIRDLNLFGYHGVKESERKDGQNFCFNLEILLSEKSFLNNDNLKDTVNYSEVIKLVKDINSNQRFNLLETLSQTIANRIMGISPLVEEVYVKIEKTSPPIKGNLGSVGIEYTLNREDWETVKENRTESSKVDVYLSLGSNIGDRENNLRKAVDLIGDNAAINVVKVSSIYETEPMYLKDQNYFYNIVLKAQIDSELGPFGMMGFLKGIEYGMGRRRVEKKYGPRIIDIDLLYYGEKSIESDFLTIPHPKIKERKFVLVPLSEVSPEFIMEGTNVKRFIKEADLIEKVNLVKNWI